MLPFNEHDFTVRVDAALQRIRTVLENTRNPQYASNVPHRYDDKFQLAEFVTRVTIASLVQCLEVVGVNAEQLATMRAWAGTRSVSLRLTAQEDCTYDREETRKVESPHEIVTETRGLLGTKTKSEKVITTIVEHFWNFEFRYKLVAYQGNEPEKGIVILGRSGSVEIKTNTKTTPRKQTVVRSPVDVNITWLLQGLDANSRASFAIDRQNSECHTPRRNPQIDEALRATEAFYSWCGAVHVYFLNELFPAQQDHGRDLAAIHTRDVFVPVVPLFEQNTQEKGEALAPASYANAFLAEERRTLSEACRALAKVFPNDNSVVTAFEAGLLVTLLHARETCLQFASGVDYLEDMLRKQLIAAIGKEVTPVDFDRYMEFHHKKLFKPEYRPLPFSYAVRRPGHDPEGVLSIEAERGGTMAEPVSTTVARSLATRPMSFALDASSRVKFLGERYLHAYISHQFSGQSGLAMSLMARARQFSSFVLLVGRISGADAFDPTFGIILQNKDVVRIPLLLEQIPTPKEFRDAIESLSPEQQRFAKAFRGMQLESTLFGVCVIQIKPQLEKLLKLPADSLTKEIKLTQDLMSLFMEYQIPSDLLSYDGPDELGSDEKLSRVKEYVRRMLEMIDLSKKREIEEEREREAKRLAEMNRTPTTVGGFGPGGPYAESAAMPPPQSAPPGMSGGAAPRRMAPPSPAAAPSFAPPVPSAPPMMAPSVSAAPTTLAPVATTNAPSQPVAQSTPTRSVMQPGGPAYSDDVVDYTRIPAELDKRFEELDEDDALRATIINPGETWTRTAQRGLLSAATTRTLAKNDQKSERNRAFDLLDAMTKSGALEIDDASLHVVLAATHCFDRTLLDTVIQQNVNPIEKVERSLMIVGTTVHRQQAHAMLADDQRTRFFETSPRFELADPPATESSNEPSHKE